MNPVNHSSFGSTTFTLKNSYTADDDAHIYVISYSVNTGAAYLDANKCLGYKIVGNSWQVYAYNGAGTSDGDGMIVTLNYVVIKGKLLQE